jgi:hypothetical protein
VFFRQHIYRAEEVYLLVVMRSWPPKRGTH